MLITSGYIAKVVATSVVWRRGGAPKRLSACPPLEIIDRAMPLIFVGPRHVKYGLLILILMNIEKDKS